MDKRLEGIIDYFLHQELVKTELIHDNPYQLLIAIVLSAQCTDKRINMVTPQLFRRYVDFEQLGLACYDDVFSLIKSISYPQVKAQRIIDISRTIFKQYDSKIPKDIDILTSINGIGRKTANLLLATLYGMPCIAVDTHVARISNRLGLVSTGDPVRIEKELQELFPIQYHSKINPWFVMFGRYRCKSRRPVCYECKLKHLCCNEPF